MIFWALSIVIRKCSIDDRSNHRYNKSLYMQMCLYAPNQISKGHFVPRVGMMLYLEFSLSKKGIDIFQSSYSSIGIIFFVETFIVKWSYNNITIFHLKNIKSNMLIQLQNTFL